MFLKPRMGGTSSASKNGRSEVRFFNAKRKKVQGGWVTPAALTCPPRCSVWLLSAHTLQNIPGRQVYWLPTFSPGHSGLYTCAGGKQQGLQALSTIIMHVYISLLTALLVGEHGEQNSETGQTGRGCVGAACQLCHLVWKTRHSLPDERRRPLKQPHPPLSEPAKRNTGKAIMDEEARTSSRPHFWGLWH